MQYRFLARASACAALTWILGGSVAHAQSDEQRAGARSLATEGAAAFNEGRYKDAADLFTRAESLVHAPPHLLFLARSHAKLGQYVKAREAYLKVIKEQLPATAPQAFRDARAAAEEEIRTVEPKIGRLTVQVAGGENAKDLSVTLDGAPMAAVLIGVPQPIDPGEHRVEATATGKRAAPQTVKIAEAGRGAVTIQLEDDPNYVAPAPAVVATPGPAGATPSPVSGSSGEPRGDTGVSSSSSGLRIGSYVAFGVGAVGVGSGVFFLLKKGSKEKELDDACTEPGGACPKGQGLEAIQDEADSAGKMSALGFAVGGAGIAAGVTLLILSSGSSSSSASQSAARTTAHVTPFVGWKTAGVTGTF